MANPNAKYVSDERQAHNKVVLTRILEAFDPETITQFLAMAVTFMRKQPSLASLYLSNEPEDDYLTETQIRAIREELEKLLNEES